jgi:hypothetical protein
MVDEHNVSLELLVGNSLNQADSLNQGLNNSTIKVLKRKNSYVAYVFRRDLNSRYTKFGLNRLRGQRVNCFSLIELVVLIIELFNLVEIA